ncbi:MAG: ABC transporter permease, partial [Chloroflexota bacterium]
MNATASGERESRSLFLTLVRFRELSIIIFIVLLIVVVAINTPAFLTVENFRNILLNLSILVIVALGQMMVIITRGIDLSVGS